MDVVSWLAVRNARCASNVSKIDLLLINLTRMKLLASRKGEDVNNSFDEWLKEPELQFLIFPPLPTDTLLSSYQLHNTGSLTNNEQIRLM